MDRRRFVQGGTVFGVAMSAAKGQGDRQAGRSAAKSFWPNGARMVVSLSMQMEAGAQPARGAGGPWGVLDTKYQDFPTDKWYEYGFKEGIPRLLDMYDRKKVKITAHMVGQAVDRNPALAKEIAQRGHETSAHGQTWEPIFSMTADQERASLEANIASIQKATGMRPYGFNAPAMRRTPYTLEILQDLGFMYYTDDLSRDEPFLLGVRKKPMVMVPYTFHLNDLQQYENRWHTQQDFWGDVKGDFDYLYMESETKRRMISVIAHDRVGGRPGRVGVLEEFIAYAQKHPGVVFMRKDEIAKFALESPLTIREGEFA
jgi:peptidoglycan/xylan/chitin deacetylase (PgdA/CDA1 family)